MQPLEGLANATELARIVPQLYLDIRSYGDVEESK
jgi:hypothetical protein